MKAIDYCLWTNETTDLNIKIHTEEEEINPSKTQIEILEYIVNNQSEILTSIFNFNQRFIYPIYNKSIDIEEEEIVNDESQLSRVYGIKNIEIINYKKSKSFYFLINFDFCYDDHGLYLIFEDTSVIDFCGEGDLSYDTIDIYQKGLTNKNDEPLEVNLLKVSRQSIFYNFQYFDEEVACQIPKGAYRVSITCNQSRYTIKFYTPIDLEKFSLKQTLLMK